MIKYQQNQILKSPTNEYKNRQFVIIKELASDFEGIIYEAKPEQSCYRTNVAIKIYHNIKEQEDKFIDWLIQYNNNNTQIIQIYEKIELNQRKHIIMQLGGCNLYNYLIQNGQLNCSEKLKIFIQTLKSIKFLHENEYICGDIKSKNYVLVENNFKLTGFGQKKRLQQQTSKEDDIKSLICLFCEIFQGELFLQGQNQKEINNQKNNYLSKLTSIQYQEITDLIKQLLLNPDPPNINQVFEKYNSIKQITQKQIFQVQINQNYLINSILDVPTSEFPQRQFVITNLLGDGGEGIVYQANTKNERAYQQSIAIKIQSTIKDNEIQFINDLIDYQNYQEQKCFMRSNIIRIYEIYKWQGKHLILMELGGKDLYSYLKEKNSQKLIQKQQICQQITQAIAFLHRKNLIHRDIKPENFIQCGSVFKLIDFGLIKKKEQNIRNTLMVGTPLYQPPELINGNGDYSFSVDVWSLGCLFFEIYKYTPLFNYYTKDQVKQEIQNHCQNQQKIHNQIDQLDIKEEMKKLIKQMVDPIPQNRPKIEEVLKQLQPNIQLDFNQQSNNIQFDYNKQLPNIQLDQKQQPQNIKFNYRNIHIQKNNYSVGKDCQNNIDKQSDKQRQEEISNNLIRGIKDYCKFKMESLICSNLELESLENEKLIKKIQDLTIKQCNEHVENYLKEKQMAYNLNLQKIQNQNDIQENPSELNSKLEQEKQYNSQLKTRAIMINPVLHKKIIIEIDPTFESSIILKTNDKEQNNYLHQQQLNGSKMQNYNIQQNQESRLLALNPQSKNGPMKPN